MRAVNKRACGPFLKLFVGDAEVDPERSWASLLGSTGRSSGLVFRLKCVHIHRLMAIILGPT